MSSSTTSGHAFSSLNEFSVSSIDRHEQPLSYDTEEHRDELGKSTNGTNDSTVPLQTKSDPSKKYQCPNCPRAFARAFNLKTHMATHNPNRAKPYTCHHSGCVRSFSRKHDLERHLTSIHRDENTLVNDNSSSITTHDISNHLVYPLTGTMDELQDHEAMQAFEMSSINELLVSPPHHRYSRRRDSLSSGDLHSVSSASSNSKSDDEILDESSFENRDTYWRTGVSILHDLENVNPEELQGAWLTLHPEELKTSLRALYNAMEGLANVFKDVRKNSKAWSLLSSSLLRYSKELATRLDSPCHIRTGFGPAVTKLVHLLKDTLRAWIRAVDPSICLSYAELPEYLRSDYSSEREKLSAFAVQGETLHSEEGYLYEIGKRIDGAFTRFSSSFSVSNNPTLPSDHRSPSKGRPGPVSDPSITNPARRLVQLLMEQSRRPGGKDNSKDDDEHDEQQRILQTQMQMPQPPSSQQISIPDVTGDSAHNTTPRHIDLRHFTLLINTLLDFRNEGKVRPYCSKIGSELVQRDRLVYQRAATNGFKEYVGYAEEIGLVRVGGHSGSPGKEWIELIVGEQV